MGVCTQEKRFMRDMNGASVIVRVIAFYHYDAAAGM